MFTGLIQQTGKVVSIEVGARHALPLLVVSVHRSFLKGIQQGESIAVDGCCLTVSKISRGGVSPPVLLFDLSEETIQKTKISTYKKGTMVNLERALKVGDRLGGHFVLGHIDGIGKIKTIKRHKGSLEIRIGVGARLALPLQIDKGSIAVDGVSLTICNPQKQEFTVFIVPHTEKMTNLSQKKPGDAVNLEMDVLGKYVSQYFSVAKNK